MSSHSGTGEGSSPGRWYYSEGRNLLPQALNHGGTPLVDTEVRIVLFTDDEYVHGEAIRSYVSRLDAGRAEIAEVDGPHRFWESAEATAQVAALCAGWLAQLA